MQQNILIHQNSQATVVDPFERSETHSDSFEVFCNNLKDYNNKTKIHKGFSGVVLKTLKEESYDIIYIDGDHTAFAAYNDAILSYPLLKKGGILIFDDYLWHGHDHPNKEIIIGGNSNPCKGINKFVDEYRDKLEFIEGFEPPCGIIDIEKLYNNEELKNNYKNEYNYQIFLRKIK